MLTITVTRKSGEKFWRMVVLSGVKCDEWSLGKDKGGGENKPLRNNEYAHFFNDEIKNK